jgi:hypothetical protein
VSIRENCAERREDCGRCKLNDRDNACPRGSSLIVGAHEEGDPVGLLDCDEPRVPELDPPKIAVSGDRAEDNAQRHR